MDRADEPTAGERVSWGEPELLNPQPLPPEDGYQPTFEFTRNGDEFGLVFTELEITLDADNQEQGLVAAKVAGFHIPLTIPDTQDLSGYAQRVLVGVTKPPEARAVVLVDVGGVAKAVEFPYGENVIEPLIIIDLPRRVTADQPGSPTIVPFTATFTLLVQRLTTQVNPIFSVHGLDVAAVFGPFEAFEFPPPGPQ
jgi:hypothetical protein